jgi:hypothetical protein
VEENLEASLEAEVCIKLESDIVEPEEKFDDVKEKITEKGEKKRKKRKLKVKKMRKKVNENDEDNPAAYIKEVRASPFIPIWTLLSLPVCFC